MKFRLIDERVGEEWKPIDRFDGKFYISNFGRIKSKMNRWIRTSTDKDGYERVYLKTYKNKSSHNFFVHRLIAIAFIPNPNNLPCINHKDGNKLNNSIENLEWITEDENQKHAIRTGLIKPKGEDNGNAKLTFEQVKIIKSLNPKLNFIGNTPKGYVKSISERFHVCAGHLQTIWSGKEWNY